MAHVNPQTLRVNGATLWYEMRGAGPTLLLIPGGNGDATAYRSLAGLLSDRFTVIRYDRRGYSHSSLDGPPDDSRRLVCDSDDARQLIERVSAEPAFVFGSSAGAIVGLDLLSRRPQSVRKLVAHEPPIATVLPDSAAQLASLDDVYAPFRTSGREVAMRKFAAAEGIESGPTLPPGAENDPRVRELMEQMHRNLDFWFEHELRPYSRFVPDVEALSNLRDRLILAGGRDSHSSFPYRPNTVLAELLRLSLVDFPGGHLGYVTRTTEFAPQLSNVLLDTTPSRRP
jgi:acetyltransferase/esterase